MIEHDICILKQQLAIQMKMQGLNMAEVRRRLDNDISYPTIRAILSDTTFNRSKNITLYSILAIARVLGLRVELHPIVEAHKDVIL